jgi:hypothetical protein
MILSLALPLGKSVVSTIFHLYGAVTEMGSLLTLELSIQKKSEFVKNEYALYTFERSER